MNRRHVAIGVYLAILLIASGLEAQRSSIVSRGPEVAMNRVITFSGTLKQGNGQPRYGTFGITFSLYAGQEGGDALWRESQTVQTDEQGHYTVLMGSTQNGGLPLELFGTGKAQWLGVEVQGEEEQPRAVLVAVPYALKAADADTVGGKPLSSFVLYEDLEKAPEKMVTASEIIAQGTSSGAAGSTGSRSSLTAGGAKPQANSSKIGRASYHDTDSNSFFGFNAGYNFISGSANSFFGYEAAYSSVTLNDNSFFGSGAGYSNTVDGNSFFGKDSGRANTTGLGNSFFGTLAGRYNTDASANSFVGHSAGFWNSNGNNNSFFGYQAGYNNQSGSDNSYFGYSAGRNASVNFSSKSSFFGSNSGYSAYGSENSFFGFNSGYSNIGNENSFFGSNAGYSNSSATKNSFVGNRAGYYNTTGNENSFLGYGAGYYNNASQNSFVGGYSGYSNTKGSSNSFFGYNAGYANTSGSYNSYFGASAGKSATSFTSGNSFFGYIAGFSNTADNNSFVGNSAGYSNTVGSNNAFVGYNAGYSNASGSNNSFYGTNAGKSNHNANGNSFVGYSAGYSNTEGSGNAFFGYNAGYSNTSGSGNSYFGSSAGNSSSMFTSSNSFFGYNSGISNTGNENVFVGAYAGRNNLSASGNSFVGSNAGFFNSQGQSNSFFGYNAGYSNTSGHYNSYFGYSAGRSANYVTSGNSMFGYDAGYSSTGDNNSFFGKNAGLSNTTESDNTLIGAQTDVSAGVVGAAAIGSRALVARSNSIVLGSINGVNGAVSDTNVGIGTTSPEEKLSINGNVKILTVGNGLIFADGSKQTTATATGPAGPTGATGATGPTGPQGPAGIGTITAVAHGTYLTGGGDTGSVTLDLDTSKVPTLSANAFQGTQTISGGNLAMPATSGSGTGVISFGGSPYFHSFGTGNVFLGKNAGNFLMTGTSNTSLGEGTASSLTTGNGNSFFGYRAGEATTNKNYNSFFGMEAGLKNTGSHNSFFGVTAGHENTEGGGNSFFGALAGYYSGTGSDNSLFGSQAGWKTSTGSGNSFYGSANGTSNTTGGSNSFFGLNAGPNNITGSYNAFFGVQAGYSSTGENNNSAFGALADITSGITNATAIGYAAKVTQSDSLVLGSINGINNATSDTKVGVGITNPERRFHVAETSTATARGVVFDQYSADQFASVFALRKSRNSTPGSHGILQNGDALFNFTGQGSDGTKFVDVARIRMEIDGGPGVSDMPGRMTFWTTPDGSAATVERMRIDSAGRVGIGITSPTERLHVSGNLKVSGTIMYSAVTEEVPDYVFEPEYKLMPVGDLEKYLASEKHLPNVPSATEIKEKGLSLSEFQMKLLEKIEELTLYTIQQRRDGEAKDAKISSLEAGNRALASRLAAIEQAIGQMPKPEAGKQPINR
jgi:hypothetical protein